MYFASSSLYSFYLEWVSEVNKTNTLVYDHRNICVYIGECGCTLYVGLAHAVPPTNTKFKPLLLPTQMGMPYTNTHKHRTSYFKSTLTFLGPAKLWKCLSTASQKPEILEVLHYQYNNRYLTFLLTRLQEALYEGLPCIEHQI